MARFRKTFDGYEGTLQCSQPKDNWAIQSVHDWPDFAFKMPDWQSLSPTEHIYLVSPGDNTDSLDDRLQGSEVDPQCFESTAPLGDVSSATVYECAGFCQGIHFIYEDSRQRTVGQCRLEMDQPVIYEKPLRLLWTCQDDEGEDQRHLTGLAVKFSMKDEDEEGKEDKEDGEDDKGWKSRAMEGRVIFRMRRGSATLSFTG
ncbi:hypothetical protein FAGAP_8610 [Fusarium agapanthi]|uniref:Uncharacterized protein n=1 Tax=Fusarium agapanthi TaxID=1803897 RepID=A0A9P5B616_9HYPO|nr:hypothetical protein FAGAP_8610 [Fusarium agapanthi]